MPQHNNDNAQQLMAIKVSKAVTLRHEVLCSPVAEGCVGKPFEDLRTMQRNGYHKEETRYMREKKYYRKC
jgi:hypothetical protein